jgi:hypothetical protein
MALAEVFRADPIVVEPPKDVPEPASGLGLLAFGAWVLLQ